MKSDRSDKQFYHIWPWTVPLTLDLATMSLLTAYHLLKVNICFVFILKFLRLMKELRTRQAVFSHLTLNCDNDVGPSHTVLVHCTLTHDGEHLCQVSSYIKFLRLMKELRTRQAVFSHLTLNCDIDLGPSHTVALHTDSWWWTLESSYIKFMQLVMELWTRQAVYSHLTLKMWL